MSLRLTPQERLGRTLTRLCEQLGAQAGIKPVLYHQTKPPSGAWEWWVKRGAVVGHGFAPSLEAARLDLRSYLNPIRWALQHGATYEPGGGPVT